MFKKLDDINNARKTALEIRKKLYKTNQIVDPFHVANQEGIKCTFCKFENENHQNIIGFFDVKENTIFINNNFDLKTQYFLVAYELGHFILNKGYQNSDEYTMLTKENILLKRKTHEDELAEAFALELMIPQKKAKSYKNYEFCITQKEFETAWLLPYLFIKKQIMNKPVIYNRYSLKNVFA